MIKPWIPAFAGMTLRVLGTFVEVSPYSNSMQGTLIRLWWKFATAGIKRFGDSFYRGWGRRLAGAPNGLGIGVLLVTLIGLTISCSQGSTNDLTRIMVGDKEIFVELAVTDQERMIGMQFRTSLAEDHGMLFIFPAEGRHVFWMKDTYIPLSVAFITKDGVITQIDEMEPGSLEHHVSRERVKYALEMKVGWFKRNNVRVGDRVKIPQIVGTTADKEDSPAKPY